MDQDDIKRMQELAGGMNSQRELIEQAMRLTKSQLTAAGQAMIDANLSGGPAQIIEVAKIVAINMAAAAIAARK